jgi:hypothetical protein
MLRRDGKAVSQVQGVEPGAARRAFFLAAIVLVFFSVYSSFYPVPNERGMPASPLHLAPSSDIQFYLHSSKRYFSGDFDAAWTVVASKFDTIFADNKSGRFEVVPMQVVPPVFPLLLKIFDYRNGNTLPLALVFVGLSLLTTGYWINILWRNGLPWIALTAFAFLPHIIWFTINLGSDLLLALWFALFYRYYMPSGGGSRALSTGLVIAILAILTRPTGVSLLVFLAIDQFFHAWKQNRPKAKRILFVFTILALMASTVIYPYFLAVLDGANSWPFFGITQSDYLRGIFDSLPGWLDTSISWFCLLIAKLLYTFGFRPSYGDTAVYLVLLRSAPGIPFFIGFIYLLIKGRTSDKLLAMTVLLPILSGPAQDRYLLPIQPLLFLYFWYAIADYFPVIRIRPQGAPGGST